MKNCWRFVIPTLLAVSCWTTIAGAETRYISDQLVVSLREQPRQSAQSITYLKTDMAVEVLEEAGEYIKVQTEAGEVGYIKQNYLTSKTPKTAIINQLQRERDRLADKANELQQQGATATSQSNKTQQELATQLTERQKQVIELKKKLEENQEALTRTNQDYLALQKNSKDVVAITQERDLLRKTNQELTATVTSLEEEVDSLMMFVVLKWFLAGAGVLLVGWIIGKSSGRPRSRF